MLKNTDTDNICVELRHQSRRATNTDAILVTEEGEEITAHQVVLSLHSRLLRTLLMKYRSYEVPKLVLCGVSKTELQTFISLLYCGEVNLDEPGIESLTELLRRLDVDNINHLSFPTFLVQTHHDITQQVKCQGVNRRETKTCNLKDVKLETGLEEEIFQNDNFEDGCSDDSSSS